MDGLKHFKAQAIIFDKDGTLIDFDAMWGGWVLYLAGQLKTVSGIDVRKSLCLAMGYDEANKKFWHTEKWRHPRWHNSIT
jgi:phosphoglycolate phosphatase-like HAD superfamily hydrolase